jgi:hypothetical protein
MRWRIWGVHARRERGVSKHSKAREGQGEGKARKKIFIVYITVCNVAKEQTKVEKKSKKKKS